MSWDDLRMFVVAARHGSLRSAALALQVSQSTLSRRIEHLESDLGFRVFDRLPDGIQLTREGHHVIRAAEQMEQASLSLRTFLDRDLTTRGIVRCTMTEGLGTFWMMPRLAEFTRANPYTVVDLRCTMAFSDVIRLETDVAVQLSRPTNPDLIAARLGRLHVVPYASKKYTSIYGTPTSKEEMAKHRIIEQVAPQVSESALPALLGLDSVEGVVALRTDASSAHFHAIETGIGLGFLPTYATALGADVIPLDIGVRNQLDIWMTYHPDVRTIPRVSLFIDWLRTIFDPRRYPWFRDDFIHPGNFENWTPEVWEGQSRSVMVHVKDLQPAAEADAPDAEDALPLQRAAGE
ncbi:MAG: LysR family transcriptional regulator [Bauldia sp.]|nr:LysR family transcriptional regulator [Bauldia sp.]